MLQLLKIAVITALVYLAFRYLLGLVFPFLIAYGIAVLLNPLLEKINRHWKIKRGILSALLVLLVFAVAGGLLGMAGYALISQAKKLVQNYDSVAAQGTQVWNLCCQRVEELCGIQNGYVEHCVSSYVPILILADYPNIRKKAVEHPIGNLIYRIGRNMKKAGGTYLKAQLIILLIISSICCVGLFLTGNSYAVLVGCGIGLCDALPFFGTGTVFIPWLLFKVFCVQYLLAGAYGIIYLICNFTREFLEPKLIGNKLSIHPMLVLISTYVGLCVFGVFGFFLGPVAGLLIAEIYKASEEG